MRRGPMRLADLDTDRIRRNVKTAGASRLDSRLTGAGVDLSLGAIEARQKAGGAGLTGRQLIDTADAVFAKAKRAAKVAQRAPAGQRKEKASRRADEALVTAACQIRIAERTPLGRGYLHALSLDVIQTVKGEVVQAFNVDDGAALAIDTHRRIQDQRMRCRAEGAPR